MQGSPFDAWFTANTAVWLLVTARAAGVCLTAPVLAAPGLDLRFRVVLAVLLGAWLAPVVTPLVVSPESSRAIVWLVLNELLIGALIGWSASLIVAAARQAGDIVAAQSGMSTSALFDPDTGEELTALGHLYGLIALATFLAVDGPLVMAEAMIESFKTIPAGRLVFERATADLVFGQAADALALAVRAAAPPAVALAAAGVALGWLGRLAPSVPLMTLSLPIRAALGVLLVSASLATLIVCLTNAWSGWGV
ncbi:MAG: flagellar biosynthetic protein FliR [Paludisphaera borealis]|uniref:flagellar biosynthetic protein FliR n=1 Tax=Paludisphaera borealis TaxID=1387353 RepID=UPI002841D82D|nr:flagellar biosynthetic protein FliR [Paludisphaera borealis]MDR3620942.1 flagellar biosynthetic protein FliR [Paludisphaera borealis]